MSGGGGGLEARVRELWVRLAQMEAEKIKVIIVPSSVADPEYVFGPPRSGSISQIYGSGFFYYQAKIVRKTLVCDFFVTFYLDVNEPSKVIS